VEASTSHNPMDLHNLLQGELYFLLIIPFRFTRVSLVCSCCESITSCIFYVLMVPVAVFTRGFARQRNHEADLRAWCLADLTGAASDSSGRCQDSQVLVLAVRCATFAFGSGSRLSNISADIQLRVRRDCSFLYISDGGRLERAAVQKETLFETYSFQNPEDCNCNVCRNRSHAVS
jgi:hypothetical protein